ncbi:MAG: hypothetical protein AB3N18_02425 [Allomuricauda sp.]
MKLSKNITFLFACSCLLTLSSQESTKKPTIKDLDFLIGKWEVQFDFYETHHPEKGVWFTEKGEQTCYYSLNLNGEPKYILCEGKLICDSGRFKGRERTFLSAIRYGNFVDGFERIGIFSNWPGTAIELLDYSPKKNQITIKGKLDVRSGLERYQDVYSFDKTYTSYTRENVANFPDMPITQFNLTFKSVGKKMSK